jgi:fatty-acyl-CoA synthase
VATLLPNCLEWLDVFLAAGHLGAVLVPLNTRYREQEISHLLRLSGAKILVGAANFEGVDFSSRLTAVAALSGDEAVPVEHMVSVGGDRSLLPSTWIVHEAHTVLSAPTAVPLTAAELDDPLIVFGTSGTTSAPKLAVHTHRTVAHHIAAVAERMGFSPGHGALQVLSLSGTFGFVPFMAGLLTGKPAALLPIFKLGRVLEALGSQPVELLVAAEGSVRQLLETLTPQNRGHLTRIVTAGLAIEDIIDAADRLSVTAMNVYGSSEVFAFAGICTPGADRNSRAMPGGHLTASGTDVRVADPETGAALPIGETGELQFRGETVFPRYLNNAAATASSRTADGWFRTGDSAMLTDTRTFRFLARANDTLRLGGYSVSPADVESTIELLPEVQQAQVVGVRDKRTGDDLGVAFVLPAPEATVDAATVLAHCRAKLASFKVPKQVVVVEAYPTTPSANGDKVRRDQLRIRATALLDATTSKPSRATSQERKLPRRR